MRKSSKITVSGLIMSILGISSFSNSFDFKTVQLSIVNNSGKSLLIKDKYHSYSMNNRSAIFDMIPETFYERDDVIRISIGKGPLLIGMFCKRIYESSIYIDKDGIVYLQPETFEKGSFIYSDNNDYLSFVVEPNKLF